MFRRRPSVLYISYDGVLEPLGQGQVLAYLEQLAGEFDIWLISFEKKRDRTELARMQAMRQRLGAVEIDWVPLAYHKTPSGPATAYDIAVGTFVALWLAVRHRVQLVHVRSYVPALMGLIVKRLTGAHLLFDMRGFWADERTDGGLWPEGGVLYRFTKALERRFLLAANHVVTLTEASFHEIARFDYLQGRMPPISVIPTCADLVRFQPKQTALADRPFTFGYIGSIGTWYMFDETLALFNAIAARRPDARLLVVNRNEHSMIRAAVEKAGIPSDRLELVAAEHHNMPDLIRRMHAASAIIRPCYSKISSAPTKVAEYLACGVPCVGTSGVGDMTHILEGNRVGVAMTGFSAAAIGTTADRLLKLVDEPATTKRCVETAHRFFSLEKGVESYRAIYLKLSAPSPRDSAISAHNVT